MGASTDEKTLKTIEIWMMAKVMKDHKKTIPDSKKGLDDLRKDFLKTHPTIKPMSDKQTTSKGRKDRMKKMYNAWVQDVGAPETKKVV